MTDTNLTFREAVDRMRQGKKARCSIWDTWLMRSPVGSMYFMLPLRLFKQLGADYEPSEIDINSSDWVST